MGDEDSLLVREIRIVPQRFRNFELAGGIRREGSVASTVCPPADDFHAGGRFAVSVSCGAPDQVPTQLVPPPPDAVSEI